MKGLLGSDLWFPSARVHGCSVHDLLEQSVGLLTAHPLLQSVIAFSGWNFSPSLHLLFGQIGCMLLFLFTKTYITGKAQEKKKSVKFGQKCKNREGRRFENIVRREKSTQAVQTEFR
jgi:hypothetical protein